MSTNVVFRFSGMKPLKAFHTHPFDGVAQVVGYNSLTYPNPYRFFGSFLAAPLLAQGWKWSPHSLRGGGENLKWAPDLY